MIRKLQPKDRGELKVIIDEIDQFNELEKAVALELIDEALSDFNQGQYNVYVYVSDDNQILGYHCIGQRPLTEGVYDLYWIVVKPRQQKSGVGRDLLSHAENFVKERNGRWILAETSSKESYQKTRNFYFRNYYTQVAEIRDFYSVGDNLIVFGKYLKM